MKRIFALCILTFFFGGIAYSADRVEKEGLKTFDQRASYALGLEIGANLRSLPNPVDLPLFIQGVQDRLEGNAPLLSDEEARDLKQQIVSQVRKNRSEQRKEVAATNRESGKAFLEENGKKEGVKQTESGLQYLIVKAAEGPRPTASDTVKVHYRGTLLDGTEFDSSYSRNRPAEFPLNGVIRGWTEGLQLMPVGSTYRFFIPANLAYGDRGSGARIGPGATLIFDIELLAIKDKKK